MELMGFLRGLEKNLLRELELVERQLIGLG